VLYLAIWKVPFIFSYSLWFLWQNNFLFCILYTKLTESYLCVLHAIWQKWTDSTVWTHHPLPKYLVHSVFEEKGYEMVSLPPYLCDLNGTINVEYCKIRVVLKNVISVLLKLKVLWQAIESINKKHWKYAVSHVRKICSWFLNKG
jgi:hypothetical protein